MDDALQDPGIPWKDVSQESRAVLFSGYNSRTHGLSWLQKTEDIDLMFQYFYNFSVVIPAEISPFWLFKTNEEVSEYTGRWT